jgi:biopolymer transport protein ExbB
MKTMNDGFWHGFQQGGALTLSVAWVLLLMSMCSWLVVTYKVIEALQQRRMAWASNWCQWSDQQRRHWREQADANDPYAVLVDLGLQSMGEWRRLQQQHPRQAVDAAEWMGQKLQLGLDRNGLRAQRHLTILASVGATAPFVGLLGTVWGIYHALTQIGLSGQASIDQVAGPVGEALIMTALGLVVAIPAVLAYNALVRLGKNRMARWREFAHQLQTHLLLHAATFNEGN